MDLCGVTEVQSQRRLFLHGVMSCLHNFCVSKFGDSKTEESTTSEFHSCENKYMHV